MTKQQMWDEYSEKTVQDVILAYMAVLDKLDNAFEKGLEHGPKYARLLDLGTELCWIVDFKTDPLQFALKGGKVK